MIIINQATHDQKTYIISLGTDDFCVYAQSEEQALEFLAEMLNADLYFSALKVEIMAKSVRKSIEQFVADADLRHCPKYNVYLPKLKIQEVSE